ncbi:flagellar basal body L-ring protein FlgH [Buchnera aphidicola]|uniref:Flagellar L-ring protein n=1 Tax=Buchnera aphidicola (Cinara cf. splendens/pseudotsugae 3390) TaxID=2518980 RepID=A0A451CWX4_9GAMM|nr:flagellar basal body L-ring protein FlgH [Buchnera aphidicola]VFP77798.1 Flagellar L-ring protein [Buchnera aphidicola (Cinara cf. splendens/pseudotsugae 3390)]
MKSFFLICKNILYCILLTCHIHNQPISCSTIKNKPSVLQPLSLVTNIKNKKSIQNDLSWFTTYKHYKVGDLITVICNENNTVRTTVKNTYNYKLYNKLYSCLFLIKKHISYYSKQEKTRKPLTLKKIYLNNQINSHFSVRIVSILKDKYLNVFGEKKILINNHRQIIQFYGIINPKKINLSDSIESYKISNFVIKYIQKNKKKVFFLF